jgi:electron transport complex protein RnfE
MTNTGFTTHLKSGLWRDNPGLVQLLGLCPLLAVTTTFANGLGLGIATLVVLVVSNVLVSLSRRFILQEIRLPVFVLIIASIVTCIELLFRAWFPGLDRSLGIFIPLIVTNCAILARAEVFASRQPVAASLADGLGMGLGFAALLAGLGLVRELVGNASLFADLGMLFGGGPSRGLAFAEQGWLLAVLPPGAFFALALAVASKNTIDARRRRVQSGTMPGRTRIAAR